MTTKQTKTNNVNAIASMVNQIQAGLKTAKAKTAKPSKVAYVATEAHIKLATEAGALSKVIADNQAYFGKVAHALRDAKVIIGDARTCPLAKAFLSARFTGKVAASTKANALASFRKAVSSGSDYSENAYRKTDTKKESKKTGAKTADTKKVTHTEASETATTYQCTIARKGSAKKAAQTLRDLMNKMKTSEEYSTLCGLIIDSLDEFDGTAE
jgi:hypothetical protein